MDFNQIIQNTNIDLKKARGTKLTKVAGFDELTGDYYIVEVDNLAAKAIIYQSENGETALVCAGKAGLWMSSVANEFEQCLDSEEIGLNYFNYPCPDEVVSQAIENGFYLTSTPSGVLELRKQLEDGFISISSSAWTDLETQSDVEMDANQWTVSRFENASSNSDFSAEDSGVVSVIEETSLESAFANAEILSSINMNSLEEEEVFFETWDDIRDYTRQKTFSM